MIIEIIKSLSKSVYYFELFEYLLTFIKLTDDNAYDLFINDLLFLYDFI